jgi:hypothetical protein
VIRAEGIRRVLKLADEIERAWEPAGQDSAGSVSIRPWQPARALAGEDCYSPWAPYGIPGFLRLMLVALTAAGPGNLRLLQVGCGPGTKLLLARDVLGLDAYGIERYPAYTAQWEAFAVQAEVADAMTWDGYGDFGIIWVFRPLRSRAMEADLEARIWRQMAPGTVIAGANLTPGPASSWTAAEDSQGSARTGVWIKPENRSLP